MKPDVAEPLEGLSADFLWIVYHDYANLARAKVVTRDRFAEAVERGVTFAKANWNIAIDDHLIPHPGFAADSGDFIARPDLSTLVAVPHRPRVAEVLSDLLDEEGAPWDGDPRGRLRAQVDALAGLGLRAKVAFETEFLLALPVEDSWRPADRGRMFTLDEVEARWAWCARVLDSLWAMQIPVHQLGKEYGMGQYELSLLPADPMAAVDRFLLARQVVKAHARDDGLIATFMPKPFAELPGNGLHVHISLWRGDDDATGHATEAAALGATGLAAVAGLLAHARGQAALGSPTPNSYKRLLPGSWAPAHVCWAFGNRAALVRVPSRGAGRRLEYRSGDASANPYLLLGGLLAAIADGVANELPAPPPIDGDVGHWTDAEASAHGAERLPVSLGEALAALEEDEDLEAMLGPTIARHYVDVKHYELARYAEESGDPQADEVTPWERATYLEPL